MTTRSRWLPPTRRNAADCWKARPACVMHVPSPTRSSAVTTPGQRSRRSRLGLAGRRLPPSNCHGVMHTVGRTYARDVGLTLATLMDYLPRSDPGCSAGFAHGLVTLRLESTRGDLVLRRRSARTRGRAINATAASTGSGTRSCASTGTGSRRRSLSLFAEPSGRRRRPTAPRARTTTTGSRPSAPTARGCRALPDRPADPLRRPAARLRSPVLVPRLRRQPSRRPPGCGVGRSRCALQRARGPPASSVRNRRLRDRAGGPGRPASDLRRAPRAVRCRKLHPRDEGSKPPGALDRYVRA